jgi:hypothetical protein
MKAVFIILFLNLALIANGQQASSAPGLPEAAEIRIQEIIKTLEPSDSLRLSLERGARGDGIHHAWMAEMKRYGIRQASFVISFNWKAGIDSLKIKDVFYLRQYYRYDTQIKERNLLRQISDVRLEQKLREAILVRAAAAVTELMNSVARTTNKSPRVAHGTLYLNLLDDEALPILDAMPDVDW